MKNLFSIAVAFLFMLLFLQCKEEKPVFKNVLLEFPSLRPLAEVSVAMLGCRQDNLHLDSTCKNLASLGVAVTDADGRFMSAEEVHRVWIEDDGYLDIKHINRNDPAQTIFYAGKPGWVRVVFEPLVSDDSYFQASVFLSQKVPVDATDKDSTRLSPNQAGTTTYTSQGKVNGQFVAGVPVMVSLYVKKKHEPTETTVLYVPCYEGDTNVVKLFY